MKNLLILAFAFFALKAFAISDREAITIAKIALESHNAMARMNNQSEQRLFEGYRKISAETCYPVAQNISCEFDTTEASDVDGDVYTPNLLKVEFNPANLEMRIEFEIGC